MVAEELVEPEVIRSDPNRTLLPGFLVAAVVHLPAGAHPSPVQGHYNRDHALYADWHARSATADGANAWLDEWVRGARRSRRLPREARARAPRAAPTPRRPRSRRPVDYGS